MRYYLVTIQYNREKKAENRTAPKSFETLNEAIAAFHKQMGADMSNDTLGWAISMVFDMEGIIYKNETWTRPEEPEAEERIV